MSAPVLPLPREGGYWLFTPGGQRFVRHPAEVIQFPRRDRAIERAVGAMIEAAIDGKGQQ